jgi:hypothetical protein
MGLPLVILAAIMGVITAPGLIAQHLEARKNKDLTAKNESQLNA